MAQATVDAGRNDPDGSPPAICSLTLLWDAFPQSFPIAGLAVALEQAMTMRTTKSTVTFTRPFRLDASGEQLPAGRYLIETDEELVDGLSFAAYHRTATVMQLAADSHRPGITEYAVVDPSQLEAALALDAAPASVSEPETASLQLTKVES
jgi:hypothetical protein